MTQCGNTDISQIELLRLHDLHHIGLCTRMRTWMVRVGSINSEVPSGNVIFNSNLPSASWVIFSDEIYSFSKTVKMISITTMLLSLLKLIHVLSILLISIAEILLISLNVTAALRKNAVCAKYWTWVDNFIRRQISCQSTSMLKGCMYIVHIMFH